MNKRLELLSFGGGVQSTAIIILIEQGFLPEPDAILWADTGNESTEVYAHIKALTPRIKAIAPFIVVRKGGKYPRLSDMVIKKARTSSGSNTLPFFLKDPNGGAPQFVRRGCTSNYKTIPLNKEADRMVKRAGADGFRWWLGISRDELQRMKVESWHPLIQDFDNSWRKDAISRADCYAIIAGAGMTAPRSSCVFCPFRTKAEWDALSPADRVEVAILDDELERGFAEHGKHGALVDRPYLRVDCKPVATEGWFDTPPDDQMAFGWDNECAGICGV